MSKIISTGKKTWGFFSNNQLKIIAMLSMFVDHVGAIIYPHIVFFRIAGRLALPLFAYMIAEGCTHTKNKLGYLASVSILALLCQFVFYFMTGSIHQNILVTFSLSIIAIFSVDNFLKHENAVNVGMGILGASFVIFITFIAPMLPIFRGFNVDYGYLGMLIPIAIYYSPNKICKLISCSVMIYLSVFTVGLFIQYYALLSIPLLALYNGQRGTTRLKYVFYLFYPLHLALIYLINFLFSNVLVQN